MPSGVITFVSETYEGSISDRKLVEVSRLLELLEPGDEIMVFSDTRFTCSTQFALEYATVFEF